MEHCRRIEMCVESLMEWCSSRRLQLNPDKTELIWFGSKSNLRLLTELNIKNLNFCGVNIEPVDSVRDLGVVMDSELTMRKHIGNVASICFFHLRRLRKLRPFLNVANTQRLVSAFILSRIDYCNAVLAGLPASTVAPLQRVMNAAARVVAGPGAPTHVSGILRELHWLPVTYRIRYKLCVLMFRVNEGTAPSYIADTTTPISMLPGHRRLRSAQTNEFDVPRTRTKFGDRAFSVAGPREWNSLPGLIRSITDYDSFKRAIKTHFFAMAFTD